MWHTVLVAVVTRAPHPRLAPFLETVWASDASWRVAPAHVERMLPTGTMHVVVRWGGTPVVLVDDERGLSRHVIGHAIASGARSRAYLKDASAPACAVGAQLRPGAGLALFGVAADELAERHTELGELWAEARSLPDRLASAGSLEAALTVFETFVLAHVPRVRAVHPAIAAALARFASDPLVPIRDVVAQSGMSHRAFLTAFSRAVGLGPKVFKRVGRFQRAVRLLGEGGSPADVAVDAGYADQPHLTRELVAIGGVTPSELRRLKVRSNHVPVERPGPRA